jgi:hypothetical protein
MISTPSRFRRVSSMALLVVGTAACSGRPAPAQTAVSVAPGLAVAHGATAPLATPPLPTVARELAPGAPALPASSGAKVMTVADVWKNRASLAGKTVTVRGKIVKYNGGILGVNWMHVQDGSGTAGDGSNDLTITSEDDSKLGETIEATGTLAIDRDLGSGYRYAAIIEKARLAHP